MKYLPLISNKLHRCKEILTSFKTLPVNFTNNPLHLQMLSEKENMESLQRLDLFTLYERFISKKIRHGLRTYRQIQQDTYFFSVKLERIKSILSDCAVAMLLDKKKVFVRWEDDRNDVNLSGVATVVDKKHPLEFIHLTFAEFLAADHFIQMCFKPKPYLDVGQFRKFFKNGISEQTIMFIDSYVGQNKNKIIEDRELRCLKDMDEQVFTHICRAGMHNLHSFLLGKVYDGEKVKKWMVKSNAASNNGMSLYFYACRSSPQLATLLSAWCPKLQVDDVDNLFDDMAKLTSPSRHCIEIALSRVKNWKSRWPRAYFFDKYLDSGFPTELYEFVLENCPDIDGDGLLQKMYSQKKCCKEFLPILLRLGADLNCERNGVRLAHLMCRDTHRGGDKELLIFAEKVARHFKSTDNFDSEESLLLRKNIGAKSTQEIKLLESSAQEGHDFYLRHVVECACALLDTGHCKANLSFETMENLKIHLRQIMNLPELMLLATTLKLYVLRSCHLDDKQRALKFFQQHQKCFPKDFKYSCGCTLVHDACIKGNLPLLEALDRHKFGLTSINKKGETPLHRSVRISRACTEFLLKRFLGKLYISHDSKHEEIVARTPDEQRHVEETLSVRDAKGRTPLIIAAFKGVYSNSNALLLLCNLLGPLVIPLLSAELVTRTELEEQQVERILTVRDSADFSPLHGAVSNGFKWGLLGFMLKNLLGKYFIHCYKQPFTQRTLEKQQQIAQLLQQKNNVGVTPLHNCAIHCCCESEDLDMHQLLLTNVLGEYFVEKDGTTARSLDARSKEENQFVRSVMFDEDAQSRSPYNLVTTRTSNDDNSHILTDIETRRNTLQSLKLLYEANAKYLL